MADKVVPLKRPDADVVELCEHLLEQAKAGQVTSVAIVIARCDGAIIPALAYTPGADAHGLLGGVVRLLRKIDDAIDDG